MTVITLRRGRKMIQVLAHRSNTVMTARTGAQHLEVIDCDGWIPQVGAVTVFADIGGADVIERFASRGHAIMAITTGLRGDVLVIEVGR